MKHLQTFEGLFTRKKQYLVKYKVTNVNALSSYYTKKGGKVPPKVLKEWDSDVYEYIIKSKSEEKAESEFKELWYEKVAGYLPEPKLTVISVEELSLSLIRSFSIELNSVDRSKLKFK